MFGMSPPLHPMAPQSVVQSIGGQQQYGMSAYQQPMPQPTSYGGIAFGLSGVGPMGLSSQNGMSMMGWPMGDIAQPRGMGAGLQGSFGSPQFVLFVLSPSDLWFPFTPFSYFEQS